MLKKAVFQTKPQKNRDFGEGSIPKHLFRLALPAVIAQIINMLYNLVDRMYVGSIEGIGTDALAGLGVCFPLILIVSAFSVLVGMGGAPLASIKLGEKNEEGAERILNTGVVMLFLSGILLTAILIIFPEQLLRVFGAPESSLQFGADYLRIYAIGTEFVLFSMGLNSFISAQGFALRAMITIAIGAAINIALDPLLIFVFDMGVKGAALATVLSQAVSCIWVIVFFLSKKTRLKIRLKMLRLKKKIVLPMLALGISPFIMQATESAVQIVFNIQLREYTQGAPQYTAALTVMMSVMQMITLPLNGLGNGTQPLISYNYGAGNFARVKKAVLWLFCIALAISAFIWILCISAPWIFAKIFSAAPEVEALIGEYMPIFMMGTIFFCAQFALQSAFLALGQSKISLFLALLRKVILLIPLTFILPLFIGVKGIFLAEGVADLTAGFITGLAFALSFQRILKKRAVVLQKRQEECNQNSHQDTIETDTEQP